MEPNWHNQGFYNNYYPPHDPNRPSERQPVSPAQEPTHPDEHRRSIGHPHGPAFLPPPPPPHTASSSHSMNLPPFSQTFYPPFHPASGGHPPASAPPGMHISHGIGYAPHVPMGTSTAQPYGYSVNSPVALSSGPPSGSHRAPPPHSYTESPRLPGYSTSPNMRHMSPTSPALHLAPPGMSASTGSASSSSYPSATRTNSGPPKVKRRSGSASLSVESWDDGEGRYDMSGDKMEGEDGMEQPWGMPQDEYKALNPRDKKQVRNRIGARRFRAKRKDYVSTLEGKLREKDDEIGSLRSQVGTHRNEINELRSRLGIPALPIPPPDALGLSGAEQAGDAWNGGRGDRKEG